VNSIAYCDFSQYYCSGFGRPMPIKERMVFAVEAEYCLVVQWSYAIRLATSIALTSSAGAATVWSVAGGHNS
jgi:hypothetical protein